MKYVRTLLILIFFLAFQNSQAQVVMQSRIAKLGYSADFMPFQESGYSSIHLDIENSNKIRTISPMSLGQVLCEMAVICTI
jgi:hypothetical protein